ncbi:monovalent cation/H(+) antiporter subunit G [Pseudoruegeria sp. SK021]|uniref:monovalent cation/H(+) antiporter subunit G n=1 Tax=Pseudoruegeria sp. SK021 TaxID=1933035 RepID=UPI000A22C9BB|nr:monovalent cation/H(+) antiporter subunit G [Pseudoruegeria sp. SK021]OSP56827.1 sodium:proton antiporter [Pseudoruegeria sp. SK021]
MTDILIGILALAGGAFTLIAGLGVFKLHDLLNRMHASTKAGTLGSILTLAAAAVFFHDGGVTARAVSIALFLLLTAPIAAHMIGRAAVRIRAHKHALKTRS